MAELSGKRKRFLKHGAGMSAIFRTGRQFDYHAAIVRIWIASTRCSPAAMELTTTT